LAPSWRVTAHFAVVMREEVMANASLDDLGLSLVWHRDLLRAAPDFSNVMLVDAPEWL
jgi:hypothetical protein